MENKEISMEERLYNLKLFEGICQPNFNVYRVPGGWLFYIHGNSSLTSRFVPYSDEFKPTYKKVSE